MKKKQSVQKTSENYLQMQLLIASILAESVNLNMDAQKILKIIGEFFAWEVGEIWAVDKDQNIIICVSHWLASNKLQKIKSLDYQAKVAIDEGIPGLIWKNKSPCWLGEIKSKLPEKISSQFIGEFGLTSCFGIPIVFQEKVLGILLFYGQNISEPDQTFLQLFTAIGHQIGMFIKRRRMEDELLHLSQHDLLTGLANRTILEKKINTEITYAISHGTKAALLYLDVDDFKKINDRFGHEFGDVFLEQVARRLSDTARETDTVARLGGDEFAILMVNIKTMSNVIERADDILIAMQKPYVIDGREHSATLSIGISMYPDDASNMEELITNADKAMYFAKTKGKNNIQISSKLQSGLNGESTKFMNDLHYAIEHKELALYYQPIVAIATNEIIGSEVLLRWRHPTKGELHAAEFMGNVLEKNLLVDVYKWIFEEIYSQSILCQEDTAIFSNLHLPFAPLTTDLITAISDIFQKIDMNPSHFTFQIKENVLHDTKVNLMLISGLKKMGINIAIDNFGIETSSINLLKNFMIDELKIDRSFIAGVSDDPISGAIVAATIAMARSLKIKTVAVGVENKAQLDFLKTEGCDEYQGNYFRRPLLLNPSTNQRTQG